MDGSEPLQQVTFRVQHDCPLARLSAELDTEMQVWSGHRLEIVFLPAGRLAPERVQDAAARHLAPDRTVHAPDGTLWVWRPTVDPTSSISRILEAHGLLWQQPLRVVRGWEHYDALALAGGEGGVQAALDALREAHPTRVVRRRTVQPEEVRANLFWSLQPALEAPTDKQAEALVAAHDAGYYRSPRQATTAQVAAGLGVARSSFEERLRAGENRVMDAVLPVLAWTRGARER